MLLCRKWLAEFGSRTGPGLLRPLVRGLHMPALGDMLFLHARVGMMRAMNHGNERVFSDRKETHWGKRKLKRHE
jgi:hypothetical protein